GLSDTPRRAEGANGGGGPLHPPLRRPTPRAARAVRRLSRFQCLLQIVQSLAKRVEEVEEARSRDARRVAGLEAAGARADAAQGCWEERLQGLEAALLRAIGAGLIGLPGPLPDAAAAQSSACGSPAAPSAGASAPPRGSLPCAFDTSGIQDAGTFGPPLGTPPLGPPASHGAGASGPPLGTLPRDGGPPSAEAWPQAASARRSSASSSTWSVPPPAAAPSA
ncbi:unnamed protein product, partial [Prorocentrum cordatum]